MIIITGKEIILNGELIRYTFEYKNVKNINLRIRADGSIYVSANRNVTQASVEKFMLSKSSVILKALDSIKQYSGISVVQYYSESELRLLIATLCERIFLYFSKYGISFPEIRFKSMISQWGNCRAAAGILTFNLNLKYVPLECIEYVVAHEFTHFLQQNHSDKFYFELSKIMPDWKIRREKLKKIRITKSK